MAHPQSLNDFYHPLDEFLEHLSVKSSCCESLMMQPLLSKICHLSPSLCNVNIRCVSNSSPMFKPTGPTDYQSRFFQSLLPVFCFPHRKSSIYSRAFGMTKRYAWHPIWASRDLWRDRYGCPLLAHIHMRTRTRAR